LKSIEGSIGGEVSLDKISSYSSIKAKGQKLIGEKKRRGEKVRCGESVPSQPIGATQRHVHLRRSIIVPTGGHRVTQSGPGPVTSA
jgi:hypothetical protein